MRHFPFTLMTSSRYYRIVSLACHFSNPSSWKGIIISILTFQNCLQSHMGIIGVNNVYTQRSACLGAIVMFRVERMTSLHISIVQQVHATSESLPGMYVMTEWIVCSTHGSNLEKKGK